MAIFCVIAAGRDSGSIYSTNIEIINISLNISINYSIKAAIGRHSTSNNTANVHTYTCVNITIYFNITIGYI